jgi:hypothetical protein
MRLGKALIALLAVAFAPLAHAAPGASAADCAGMPPCGYITPIVDMEMEGKPKCVASSPADLAKCTPLPAKGQSVAFSGTFRYYWKLSEDLTYPPDPGQPITVTFSGVSNNPQWMAFKVEPDTITIDTVALFNPQNMRVDQSNPSAPILYYDYRAPLKITFTRVGDPDQASLDKIAGKLGVLQVFVKAKSSTSGTYFKEGFGVESFGFDASSLLAKASSSHASPAGVLAPLAGLAVAAARYRRR